MSKSRIHFIVQSLPASEDQFQEKLQNLNEKRGFYAPSAEDIPPVIQELQQYVINQCVVAPKHIAFLLDDGRVCRVKYIAHDVQQEEAELSNTRDVPAVSKSPFLKLGERPAKVPRTGTSPWIISGTDLSSGNASALRRWGTHIGVIRSIASSSGSNTTSTTTANSSSARNRSRNNGSDSVSTLASTASGIRLVRSSQLIGRGRSLLTGQRVIVPASLVPEELVNQVQGILQGKSRSIIIRELQRTNLDVNLAVNNLLSRDDEDNDDMEDNGGDYIPGDDLLSLLDSGNHPGEHGVFMDTDAILPEELLGYTLHRTSRTSSSQRSGASGGDSNSNARDSFPIRDPIIRLRNRRFFEPVAPWDGYENETSSQSKSTTTTPKRAKVTKELESVNIGEQLEWWMENDEYVKFVQIGSMYSELVGVDNVGMLRQWRWGRDTPYRHPTQPKLFHPRAQFLGLEDKKVIHLATCAVRASVMVESGGVATWIDKSVSRHASALEHTVMAPVSPNLAMTFDSEKHKSNQDKCLHVCSLYTTIFTPAGEIYWWGVLPFHLRKTVLEKAQAKLKKALTTIKSSRNSKQEVKAGSLVCLHSCPMFQAGAIAIYLRGGKPQIGCLQQSAWNLSDKCFFKILKRKNKKIKIKDKRQTEKKRDAKMDDDKKDDSVQPKADETEALNKESSVIQSNSERETVLKSTSSTPIVSSQISETQKAQKRKLLSKPIKDIHFTNLKEEDPGDEEEEEEVEEQWNLQDVVFIEDVQTVPVGKVVKVDGDMVAVWFSKSGKFSAEKMEKESMLKNLRLLRKEDVHVLTSGSLPKVPECFLKAPRKLTLDSGLKIHTICVNELGIQAIEGGLDGSPLTHLNINMLGKVTADCPFLSPPEMFFEPNKTDKDSKEFNATSEGVICKLTRNCQDFPTIFQDRFSTLYPLLRNENSGFRDPHWLNLTPMLTMGMGAYVPLINTNLKNEKSPSKMLMVTTLIFKSSPMMPLIVRRDHKNVEQMLERLTQEQIEALCDEISDGQRNILHVAISTTAPSSNRKQQEEEEEENQRKKEQKKRDSFFSSMTSTSTTGSQEPSSTVQSTAQTPMSTSTSRSNVGSQSMSDSERSNAVNAIANAISVVTRGERLSGETGSARNNPRREPYSTSSDSFSMPVPPPSYVRSQLMRDFMQQFASSSPTVSSTVVSPPTSVSSGATVRQVPTIVREGIRLATERRGAMDYGRLGESPPLRWSPPPVPTLSWPPEPVSYGMLPASSGVLDEGLLSASGSEAPVTSSGVRRNSNKKAKRKRSITPPNADNFKVASKRGTVADGLAIIKTLCTSEKMQPVLFKLLTQRDALGHTPFMSAIFHRAYPAALEIFSQVRVITRRMLQQQRKDDDVEMKTKEDSDKTEYDCDNAEYEEIFMKMIYPNTRDRDANPLYMLCANDTCSFTWTGDNHINQDIFECWTCGLVGTLCCCSECARVCHNGHDCKLKKTNPTAYCDCWEKCACRSLISGDANSRKQLAKKLLQKTNLVNFSNSRGETLLQFLAQTVARQKVEQRQHRNRSATASSRTSRTNKTTISGVECDVPQHDLQPPQFCWETCFMLLNDWKAVCATIMSNTSGHMDPLCASFLPDQSFPDASILLPEEVLCMESQTGTSRLDAFTLCLLVKCSMAHLDSLLHTFINRLQRTDNAADKEKDLKVVHRFVRSVVRVFVVLSVCSSSEKQSGKQSGRNLSNAQPLKKAQKVFTALLPMAIEELCEMATALIDPVRMGVARPTSMFPIFPTGTDAVQGCETAFSRPPFPPRDKKKKKKGGKGRNQRESSASPMSFSIVENTAPRPVARSNIARRGISHRRQNFGSSRTAGSGNGSAGRGAVQIARDALHDALADDLARNDALADDLVRITMREREQDANSLFLDRAGFSVLPNEEDEEVDALVDDWLNQDEPNDTADQEESTQEENQTQSTLQAGESQEVSQPMTVEQTTSREEDPADSIDHDDVAEEEHDTEEIGDNQPELVSEGDLDDEDDDRPGQDDEGAGDVHDGDESDMDLTLLAASDADTDPDSNHSDAEEQLNRNGDAAARRDELNNMSRLLYSDEDDGLSGGDLGEDDDDDDDEEEDGGDEDDDDRHTYTVKTSDDDDRHTYTVKTSDDEAVTATDQEEDDGSSQDEEDIIDEDADDQDDEDAEEDDASQLELSELPLERAPTRLQRSKAAMTPHSMRWALGGSRSFNTAGTSSRATGSGTTGSGLIYIDSSSLRRGNPIGASTTSGGSGSGDSNKQGHQSATHSAATTNAQLARAFAICVREMSSLFNIVWQGGHITNTTLSTFLELTSEDVKKMKDLAETTLSSTWKWLLTVIDSTEAQLRYGQVLALAGSQEHIDHPLYKDTGKSPKKQSKGTSSDSYKQSGSGRHTLPTFLRMTREANNDSNAARQDFLSYILSLMRSHSGEHADYLPVMDVSSLRHVAYVLDAMIFYLRETAGVFGEDSKKRRQTASIQNRLDSEHKYGPSLNLGYDNTDDEDEDEMIHHPVKESSIPDDLYSLAVSDVLVGDIIANAQEEADPTIPYAHPQKTFFKRSDSMTFLGCTDPDPFTEPLVKALPLADKPHLLQTNARKEELFGRPRQQFHPSDDVSYFDPDLPGTGMGQLRHKITSNFQEKLERTKAKLLEKKNAALSQISIGTQTESEVKAANAESQNTADSVIIPPMNSTDKDEKVSADVEPMDTMTSDEVKTGEVLESTDDLPDLSVLAKTVIVKTETQKEEKETTKKEMKVVKRGQFCPPSVDSLLGRCRLTLELFTRVFLEDVGAEPKSILQELGGFEVREEKFRKEMEKLRNSQSVDLQLNVEREPHRLITQTFKQLNQHFRRRTGASSASLSTNSQPLAVQRVKVIFKDEPGEGSGVARSFYTALCEALLSSDKLPSLENILVPLGSSSHRNAAAAYSIMSRLRKREEERERERRDGSGRTGGRKGTLRSFFMARYSQSSTTTASTTVTSSSSSMTSSSSPQISTLSQPFPGSSPGRDGSRNDVGGWSRERRAIGDRLLPKVNAVNSAWGKKITGMLLGLPVPELLLLLSSESLLKTKIADATRRLEQIQYAGEETRGSSFSDPPRDSASDNSGSEHKSDKASNNEKATDNDKQISDGKVGSDHESEDEEVDVSTFPLFYQPGKRGFYSPAAGVQPKKSSKPKDSLSKKSRPVGYEARVNAFRNVGRIIGLCLLQNELCPLPLNRHVLKALLGRKINWHDFAFFDPVMYESTRFVLADSEKPDADEELLNALEMSFVANLLPEEGGGEIELIPGGSDVSVTHSNLHDFVRRYTTYRMITCCHKYIDSMRDGLFDVLPRSALDGLTAEDLRLLANGCGRVNVRTLISYTSFNDESGKSSGSNTEKLTEFKRWFWTVVERMGHSARQELLYFWTGSPALPAGEDGFQPMPTVTIRPPDDQHLPSANTCISRLYVPLYSTRTILKQKLMIAIKTKNFGFV